MLLCNNKDLFAIVLILLIFSFFRSFSNRVGFSFIFLGFLFLSWILIFRGGLFKYCFSFEGFKVFVLLK